MQKSVTTTSQVFETNENTSVIEVTFTGTFTFTPAASTNYYTVVKFTESGKDPFTFIRKTAGTGSEVATLDALVVENPTASAFTDAVTATATVYYTQGA